MLTSLQKRKLIRYFNTLDDGAKGYLTEEDIYAIGLRMAERKGVFEQTEEFKGIKENTNLIWTSALANSVSGDPDKIYVLDWIAQHNAILTNDELTKTYLGKIGNDIFELFKHQDGNIYPKNYFELISCFGVDEAISNWAFKKLDVDSKGFLRKTDYLRSVEEFFLANDCYAPGNYYFGPF